MNCLEERILKDGIVKEGNVLKVDSFLNHQMDINLFNEMGAEWKRRFEGKNINKKLLTPATVGIVDRADIKYCDLTITPYSWTVRGESGISAYLVKMFVIIQEDPLEARYAMLDDNLDEQAEIEIPFE